MNAASISKKIYKRAKFIKNLEKLKYVFPLAHGLRLYL